MADVDMGLNVYEFNKNIMKQLPIMEVDGLNKVKEELNNYIDGMIPSRNYLMMLCREKNDYTLFNFHSRVFSTQFADDVIECMENRGYGIVNCEVIDRGAAIELWVKKPGQMEDADLYYIFPADNMVIEY